MTHDPNGGIVRVTTREIYDLVLKIHQQGDSTSRDVRQLREDFDRVVVADHRKRLRGLEFRFYGVVAGMLAGLIFLATRGNPL